MPLNILKEDETLGLQSVKYVLGVAAGKGGVGKSTVTVNLGHALKRLGFKVGILDADIYGPSLRKMVPEDRLPYQKGSQLYPADCQGMSVMSMAYFRKEGEASAVRAPIAQSVITQFLKNISWGALDFLLIDFPPGTGDIQLTLTQQAKLSGAIMVTTPQEVALMDVRKAIHLFKQVNIPILGVVENMSYYLAPGTHEKAYLFGKEGGKRLAEETQVPFLGEIPLEPALGEQAELGKSLLDTDKSGKSPIVIAFLHLAETVVEALKQNPKGDLSGLKSYYFEDRHTLALVWEDGSTKKVGLTELQKRCPCARCVDEATGLRKEGQLVAEDVGAEKIELIGRYALKIQFTSGCSTGLYDFNLLRTL